MSQNLEVDVTPIKELFYRDTFGVYACETADGKIKLNSYQNFVMSGNMPQLTLNMLYRAVLEKSKNKKYPDGYDVVQIVQEKPQSVHDQQMYIKTLIKEKHANEIIRKYPNHDLLEMFENDKIDYSDMHGIGKITYEKIKNVLLKNLQMSEALVKLSPLGITFKMLHKFVAHYGDVQLLMQEIDKNIYTLTQINGLSFKKVDEYSMKRGDDKHSDYRIEACINYLLNQEASNGHSWVTKHEIIEKAEKTLCIERDYIRKFISDEWVRNAKREEEGMSHLNKLFIEENRIALQKNYNYEYRIGEKVHRLLHTKGEFIFVDEEVEERIREVEEEQGFKFTDEQREAIYLATKHNVLIINGRAGTGKSSVLKGVLNVLGDYTYETCCLSGKASLRILETGVSSQTIHRLLEFRPKEGFNYNEKNPLTQDVIVLDEAGMVGAQLFHDLVRAVRNGAKLIICGDNGQLAPIGNSNIFQDLLNDKNIPKATLRKVHRQAEKSGILSCANMVRESKSFISKDTFVKQVYGELKDFHLFPLDSPDYIQDNIIQICKNYKGDKDELIVITAMKQRGDISTTTLNALLQPIFNPHPTGEKMKRGDLTYCIGDRVIVQGNDYNKGIFNAQIGKIHNIETIIKVDDETEKEEKIQVMDVKFDGMDKMVRFEKGEEGVLDLAYALTCHRMQGSAYRNVIVALSYSSYFMLSRQWLYTAMTRASKYCIMVAENAALQYAIGNNESGKRKTFLGELLKEIWEKKSNLHT